MNKNEENLNILVEKLNFELKQIKDSNEYKLGRRIYKNWFWRKIVNLVNGFKKKKLPEDELDYCYKNMTNDYGGLDDKKIVVYKCVTGGYDEVVAPEYKSDKIDYVLFTNNKKAKSKGWKVVYIGNINDLDNATLNRYVRMHPSKFLAGYDYAIYVDGNMMIYSDLSCLVNRINKKYGLAFSMHSTRKKITSEFRACKALGKGDSSKMLVQVQRYLREGMPDDYGLLETTVIAIDLHNKKSEYVLNQWWDEFFRSGSMRDQIALSYVLWRDHIKVEEIGTLGNNIWLDPKFTKVKHLR